MPKKKIKAVPKTPKPKAELIELQDPTERAMVVAFMIQMHKKIAITDLRVSLAEKLGVKIHPSTLKSCCNALKKGKFVTIDMEQDEKGFSKEHVAMRTTVFKGDIEIAQLGTSDFLPRLLATEGAQAIKAWFENEAKQTNPKASNRLQYRNMHNFTVEIFTLEDLIGSQIPCQRSDIIRKSFPEKSIERYYTMLSGLKEKDDQKRKQKSSTKDVIEVTGLFARCPLTGAYLIPSDVLRGWWKANVMRYTDLGEGTGDHIAFNPIYIEDPKNIFQLVLPVNSSQGSSIPKAYECIGAGEKLELSFASPTTGYLHPEQIELLVLVAGLRPKRGLSPARGVRYGRFLVTNFIDHGPVNAMDPKHCGKPPQSKFIQDRSYMLQGYPPSIIKKYGAYAKEAFDRLSTVALGDAVHSAGKDKAEPFPVGNEDA